MGWFVCIGLCDGGGGGGGAPSTASYLVLGGLPDPALPNARTFTPGAGLAALDGGPGNPYVVAATAAANPVQVIEVIVGAAAGNYDSVAMIPAGAIIVDVQDNIGTAYDGGATHTVGTPASPAAFLAAAEVDPTVIDLYEKEQQTPQGAASVVRVVVGGAPTVGAGAVLVFYAVPLP